MHNELTNLLPSEYRAALMRSYFLRLSVVGVLAASVLIAIAMILLVPTYMLLTQSARTKEARLATIDSALASTDQTMFSARLSALSSSAAELSALDQTPSASAIVRSMLALPRSGISLSDFTYTPAGEAGSGVLTVSGIAATRESLRSYQIALQGASFTQSADLPVSAYAKDSNIRFTITVTLAP